MASIVFEVECECEGRITPAEPDVGIFGEGVEDADLSSVSMLVRVRHDWKTDKPAHWRNVDLLEGLDKAARDQVIANIMSAHQDDIIEAILSDA